MNGNHWTGQNIMQSRGGQRHRKGRGKPSLKVSSEGKNEEIVYFDAMQQLY